MLATPDPLRGEDEVDGAPGQSYTAPTDLYSDIRNRTAADNLIFTQECIVEMVFH